MEPQGTGEDAGVFPTELQACLIRAAVLDGAPARRAWAEWRPRGLDALDVGSFRLLPQLYRNLVSLGVDDPLLGTLEKLHHYHRYRNQVLLHRAGEAAAAFRSADIPTLVLKGAALAVLHYGSLGARPMEDVDLLVPRPRIHDAMRVLREAGFAPGTPSPEERIAIRHAELFQDGAGRGVDLHWYALWQQPFDDDDFWQGAVSMPLGGETVLALNPVDQILHACVHGAGWNPVSPIRWVADAMIVLRSAETVDWSRLIDRAVARRLIVPVRSGSVQSRAAKQA